MAAPPPFALEGLDHVVLLVGDMDRALDFYCGVLGCSVDRTLPDHAMVQLPAGVSLIDLVDIGAAEGAWAKPPVEGGRNMSASPPVRGTKRRCAPISPPMPSPSSRRECATAPAATASPFTSPIRSGIRLS
jgi:hypothetical protein